MAVPALAGLFAAADLDAQQEPVDGVSASPVLAAWAPRLAAGDSAAARDFWREVERAGTPLVSRDPNHADHSIVTFLARGGPDVERIRLATNLNILLADGVSESPDDVGWLERLEGSHVWYRSFRLRNDLRIPYRIAVHERGEEEAADFDPLNPQVWEPGVDALRASILELPEAPPQPWRDPSGEEGEGDWDELTADDGSGRSVYVYKPSSWDPQREEPYPALIGLGAFGHGIGMRVDRMVDFLIDAGRLPPMVVLLVDLTGEDETTRYESVASFLVDELLPYAWERYAVTDDPRKLVVSGTSRRGMVASLLGLEHPRLFGNVLSLSGSYYWAPDGQALEWVPRRYAEADRRPVRFYIAAGELESWVTPTNRGHYLLATNRHMRDVLVARQYPLRYVEFNGVHSELNWQDWLADGLVTLLGSPDEPEPGR